MNILNAAAFAAIGSLMEILPRAFPSWFPPTHTDEASCRALWLDIMGAVQMTVGFGHLLRAHAAPFIVRLISVAPAGELGALPLPIPRGLTHH
jgi:hypothetical protein